MTTKFNENDLIKLFPNQPINMHDDASCEYFCIRKDAQGSKLIMYMSAYEEVISLSLYYGEHETKVLEMDLKNITEAREQDGKLVIKQEGNHNKLIIHFEPAIWISWVKKSDY